jgi:hypothetical protein
MVKSYGLLGGYGEHCGTTRYTFATPIVVFAVDSNNLILRRTVSWRRECQSILIER